MTPSTLLLFLAVGTALLSGCATSSKYVLDVESGTQNPSIKLIDKRSEDQKRAEVMSGNITDCWYGVYRLGDEQTEPGRLSYLMSALDSRLGREFAGKTVQIDTFEVFNNWQSVLRPSSRGGADSTGAAYGLAPPASGAGVVGTALGTAIVGAIASGACRANSPKLAVDRNPSNLPAVIVNYDLAVDSRRVKGTVLQLDPQGSDSTSRGAFVSERVKRAMSSAVEAIASELKASQ